MAIRHAPLAAAVVAALVVAGCSGSSSSTTPAVAEEGPAAAGSSGTPTPAEPAATTAAPAPAPTVSPSPAPTQTATAEATPTTPAHPLPPKDAVASMSIPALGIDDLDVVPYEGTTDDRAGTEIQDGGVAASPRGRRGGVGPGEVGNYLVTAHRLSAGSPLRDLPDLDEGEHILVEAAGYVYDYEVTETRKTSFRTKRSLAEQRAAVPGKPGAAPVDPMITVSTCATLEDNAEGNFWRDENGNPEHRIDKVGVLVDVRKA
jgi:sortase A